MRDGERRRVVRHQWNPLGRLLFDVELFEMRPLVGEEAGALLIVQEIHIDQRDSRVDLKLTARETREDEESRIRKRIAYYINTHTQTHTPQRNRIRNDRRQRRYTNEANLKLNRVKAGRERAHCVEERKKREKTARETFSMHGLRMQAHLMRCAIFSTNVNSLSLSLALSMSHTSMRS